MSLDIVNNILNGLKESDFMNNFLNELSNYLKNNINHNNGQVPLLNHILSDNKLTTANENCLRDKFDETLIQFAKDNFKNDTMYFVQDNKKSYWSNNSKQYDNDIYTVLKIHEDEIEEIDINKNDIDVEISVNDIFSIKNNKYIVENSLTQDFKDTINDVTAEIINNQNKELSNYRKDGHLYMVSEEVKNNRFLIDLTDNSGFEFEEVDIPEELLSKATEGMVLKYSNGTYEYFSDDGFERLEKTTNLE